MEAKKHTSITIPASKIFNLYEAEQRVKEIWGVSKLYSHYFKMDDLWAWFLEEPDEYYQNYIAQMGKANLVIDIPPDKKTTDIKILPQKTLYERWVDTLKCPECGGNDFEIETEETNPIGEAIRVELLRYIYCKICGFTSNKREPIDFINNERRRLYEKWRGKVKLSDLEMGEIT